MHPMSPVLHVDSLPTEPSGKLKHSSFSQFFLGPTPEDDTKIPISLLSLVSPGLILPPALCGKYHQEPPFTGDETETQRG